MKLNDARFICEASLYEILDFFKESPKWEIEDKEHISLQITKQEFLILRKKFGINNMLPHGEYIFSLEGVEEKYKIVAFIMN